MPWILCQRVSFSWKDEKGVRDVQALQSAFQQNSFEVAYPHIRIARDHVSRCLHFVELKECGLGLVEVGLLPWSSAEVPGIIKREIVISPVGRVLNRTCTCDGGFE